MNGCVTESKRTFRKKKIFRNQLNFFFRNKKYKKEQIVFRLYYEKVARAVCSAEIAHNSSNFVRWEKTFRRDRKSEHVEIQLHPDSLTL